jgi:hypothetical protein
MSGMSAVGVGTNSVFDPEQTLKTNGRDLESR